MTQTDQLTMRRDFGRMILRAGRQWRAALDRELQKFGLTSAMWRPLFYVGELGELGDGARAKDLAEALAVEPPTVAVLLDRLERDGFIHRVPAADDRRSKVIGLTDKGRQAFIQTQEVTARVGERLMDGISDADIAISAAILDRIVLAAAEIQ